VLSLVIGASSVTSVEDVQHQLVNQDTVDDDDDAVRKQRLHSECKCTFHCVKLHLMLTLCQRPREVVFIQ